MQTLLNKFSSICLLCVLLASCASTEPKPHTLADAFNEAGIRSILVLPALNNSIQVAAPGTLSTILPRALAEHGYYVFPVNTVKVVLENEGLYEASEIYALEPSNLANMFDADAILYSTVIKWDTQYVVLAASSIVTVEFKLVAANGQVLWQDQRSATKESDSTANTGSTLGNLISNAISAAAQRGFADYRPLAKELSNGAAQSLPIGPVKAERFEQLQQQNKTN